MRILDALAAKLGYRRMDKFVVRPDGSWPAAYLITGDGGLRDLLRTGGSIDGGESARLPSGGPRLGRDGKPRFFQRGE